VDCAPEKSLAILTQLEYNGRMKEWTGQEIREVRIRLEQSQKSFAQRLGVTLNYVHLLEKGVKRPSKTLKLLLDCIEKELVKH